MSFSLLIFLLIFFFHLSPIRYLTRFQSFNHAFLFPSPFFFYSCIHFRFKKKSSFFHASFPLFSFPIVVLFLFPPFLTTLLKYSFTFHSFLFLTFLTIFRREVHFLPFPFSLTHYLFIELVFVPFLVLNLLPYYRFPFLAFCSFFLYFLIVFHFCTSYFTSFCNSHNLLISLLPCYISLLLFLQRLLKGLLLFTQLCQVLHSCVSLLMVLSVTKWSLR